MNTMNHYYFCRIRRQQKTYSKTLNIIHKVLVVISVYLIFGLLLRYVYANTDHNSSSDPYQAQHGSVWLLPDNGACIEALQTQTDIDYAIT